MMVVVRDCEGQGVDFPLFCVNLWLVQGVRDRKTQFMSGKEVSCEGQGEGQGRIN